MAYTSYDPTSDAGMQALEDWFQRARQQRLENPLPGDSVAGSPFASKLSGALPENYAQTSSGTVLDFGASAPRAPDVWQSGTQVLRRQQQSDGTFLVTKRVPTYDSEGRQSAVVVQDVEVPDYLNPAKLKELAYRKALQELQPKPMEPKLVDGQWILPPSSANPSGQALQVPDFQRKPTAESQKEKAAQEARDRMAGLLDSMEQDYKDLADMGGIVTPKNTTLQNLGARAKGSWLGQAVSGAVGTDEQVIRDKIAMTLPSILNEIRLATAMGVTQLNTQKELEFYAKAATDPSRTLEANLDALKRLRESYVTPRAVKAPTAPAGTAPSRDMTPPDAGQSPRNQALMQEALDAINRGADPVAVKQRLEQMGVQLRY